MQRDSQLHLRLSQLLLWFMLGAGIGAVALMLELTPQGSHVSDVLRVGVDSPARPIIEGDLGPISLSQGTGHDGQYSYLVARDPFALGNYSAFGDDVGYRFRRALYGWVAGGFGLLSPYAALWGLAFWGIVGLGIATAAIADIAISLQARMWAVGGVAANIGMWLSVQLATPDALAMGLSLTGVAFALRKKYVAAAWLFAAAGLTKETFLLFPIAIGGWLVTHHHFKRAVTVAAPALVALVLWSTWLNARVGNGFSAKGNLSWPLVGLWHSLPWSGAPSTVLGLVAVVGLLLGVVGAVLDRSRLLWWLVGPWVAIALISSGLVWMNGDNAVRALAPNWTLGLLALAHWTARRIDATPEGTDPPS